MNIDYISAFSGATEELFNTMTTIEISRGKPYLKTDNTGSYYVSGAIGLAGQATGAVVLSFPKNLAIEVISNFLGEPLTKVDQIVKDGIGELTNIISGGAKKRLGEKNYSFKISIPIVVIGNNHQITLRSEKVPCVVIPFFASGEGFAVEVSLKRET